MTVPYQVPVTSYSGDGVQTTFPFTWQMLDEDYIRVEVDGVLQQFGVAYQLRDWDALSGGEIVFYEDYIPGAGTRVRVRRETAVTQELDYTSFTAFPADAHELQMDKDTHILQEVIDGGRAFDGPVDLGVIQNPANVVITNTAGEGATILPWQCAGGYAGAFMGEVTNSAPADGEATNRPDGYVWIEIDGTVPAPGNGITMPTSAISLTNEQAQPLAAYSQLTFIGTSNITRVTHNGAVVAATLSDIFDADLTGAEQMWVRFDLDTGSVYTINPTDTWLDAYLAPYVWGVYRGSPGSSTITGTLRVAPDNGGGAPDTALEVTRSISLTATMNSP